MALSQKYKMLMEGDTIRHHQHGIGSVVNIKQFGEYPVEAVFKDSPGLRIKVPVSVFLSFDGYGISYDKPLQVKLITKR